MTPMPTDAEAIVASLHDPARFAVVFDRHYPAVFRFAERRVGHDQAGDVAAEVMARAFARRGRYRPDTPDARPWLYGIASNLILQERRRFSRYLSAVDRLGTEVRLTDADGGIAASDARMDAAGEWRRLRVALLTLSDTDRELLLLVAWDDLSYLEAGHVLGIAPGTVRSKLHRARARLRELLEPTGETPADRQRATPEEAMP